MRVKPPVQPPVVIKGTKDGLLFTLDDKCPFDRLRSHLEEVLEGEGAVLFSSGEVSVAVDYGSRRFSNEEHRSLLATFLKQENFVIKEWGAQTRARQVAQNREHPVLQNVIKGTVRNGQQWEFDGDVVLIGDVNPGGQIIATGDIYVFGRLQGIAHAGAAGRSAAIIAAAEFAPLQLRIASVVSRPPELESGRPRTTFMEFAYVQDGVMAVDKVAYRNSLTQ